MYSSFWLGRKDSNLRMPLPKSGALPLGYAPINCLITFSLSLLECKNYIILDKHIHQSEWLFFKTFIALIAFSFSSKTAKQQDPLPVILG